MGFVLVFWARAGLNLVLVGGWGGGRGCCVFGRVRIRKVRMRVGPAEPPENLYYCQTPVGWSAINNPFMDHVR